MRGVEKGRAKGNLALVIVFISAVGGDRRESRRGRHDMHASDYKNQSRNLRTLIGRIFSKLNYITLTCDI